MSLLSKLFFSDVLLVVFSLITIGIMNDCRKCRVVDVLTKTFTWLIIFGTVLAFLLGFVVIWR